MQAHPLFRPLAVATAVVVLLAVTVFGLLASVGATLEGLPLALVQRAANAAETAPVLWIGSDRRGADPGRLRAALARAVEAATRAGARATVIAVPLAESSDSADLGRVRSFLEGAEISPDAAMRARLQAWVAELDHDGELERAVRAAGNVALLASPNAPPLERFANAARAVAYEPALAPDADGVSRRDRLYSTDSGGTTLASLSFAGWLVAHGLPSSIATPGDGPRLVAAARLRIGPSGTWVPFYGRRAAEDGGTAHVALEDLAAGRVPAERLRQQIVVIGDGDTPLAVATGAGLAPGEAIAQRIASLELDSYAVQPRLARLVSVLALLGVIAWAALGAPRLSPTARVSVTLLLVLALVAIELVLIGGARIWVPLSVAALALPLATLAVWLTPEPREDRHEPVVPRVWAAPGGPVALRTPRPVLEPAMRVPEPEPAQRTAPTASLREISETLEARREEPTRAEVADLLLGRSKRPPKPRLGRYELERELGKGAMGTVYLGRDPRINRVVAIKAIPIVEEFSESDLAEARARFFREAEMAGGLKHPGIVTVYDAGEDAGIAWIAMEYVHGEMLSEYVASDRLLPAGQVLEVVARVADALEYAHGRDVVHRDIKPANVLFDRGTLEIKITDFGIARLTNSSSTRSGIVLGTPSFMAPEQLEGRNVTGRSDLFALGVTLFQLLAGQLPFRADSMTGLMDKIANAAHPPLKTIRPDLPPCVSSIVDRALQKDPANRYSSAAEMAQALRACARSLA